MRLRGVTLLSALGATAKSSAPTSAPSSSSSGSGSAGVEASGGVAHRSRSPRRPVTLKAASVVKAASKAVVLAQAKAKAKAKSRPPAKACGREGVQQPPVTPPLVPHPPTMPPPPHPPTMPPPPKAPPLPPPLPPPAEGRELRGWCSSCYKWRAQCFRRWDWACPTCENHNYANRQQCARCGQARHAGQLLQEGSGNLDWSSICSSHGCPMFMCFKPFDWLCSCGNHNFASKMVPRCRCLDVWVFRSSLLCLHVWVSGCLDVWGLGKSSQT